MNQGVTNVLLTFECCRFIMSLYLDRTLKFIGCRLCRRPLRFDDSMFWWILIGNGGFGASQFGLRFGAALPDMFFSGKT